MMGEGERVESKSERALEPFLSEQREPRGMLATRIPRNDTRAANAAPAAEHVVLFFPHRRHVPERASDGGLAALTSFLANAYTIHIARSSNDAPTRRTSVVLSERRLSATAPRC